MKLPKLVKFAFVGGVGFVVDMSIFTLCYQLIELGPMTSRAIAFVFAATTTWLGNRWFTFSEREKSAKFQQWKKFFAAACFSAAPNFLVFKLVSTLLISHSFGVYIALPLGILAGMISNYFLSDKWIFT